MKLKLSKALLVAPARPVHCGLISVLCNPNVVSGTNCLTQDPLPSQSGQSWFSKHFSTIWVRFRPWKPRLWRPDFNKKRCRTPERHFWKNQHFASMRTQFSRTWEPRNRAQISYNSTRNGTPQKSKSITWKTKLGSRNSVPQGAFGTAQDALLATKS